MDTRGADHAGPCTEQAGRQTWSLEHDPLGHGLGTGAGTGDGNMFLD